MRRVVLAALLAALTVPGCGPKAILVGSRPFPAERAVFTDASGKALSDLPAAEGAVRLVVLDFPWCPPCREAWGAVGAALDNASGSPVRTYRILFDREVSLSASGTRETPPMHPAEPPWPEATTLTAVPGTFREEFRVSQAPVLLLIDGDGTVVRRWNGYSTALAEDLALEIRKRSPAPSALPPGK